MSTEGAKAIVGIMEANATLLTACPAARIVPHNTTQDDTLPRITYHLLGAERVSAMGDDTGQCRARYQVMCWAETYTGAVVLGDLIRKAVNRKRGTYNSVVVQSTFLKAEFDMPRDEAGAYGIGQDYELTHLEAQ